MLAEPELETRADAVTNIATAIQDTQLPIAPRVFPRSSVAYLGIMTPTVQPGTVSYPRLSAGTDADVRSDGAELDGTAAALTTESINPVRLTASYTWDGIVDVRVRGFSDALRRDIAAVLSDKRDRLAIQGQAVSGTNSPAVEGVINALTDPDPNPTTVAAFWRLPFRIRQLRRRQVRRQRRASPALGQHRHVEAGDGPADCDLRRVAP